MIRGNDARSILLGERAGDRRGSGDVPVWRAAGLRWRLPEAGALTCVGLALLSLLVSAGFVGVSLTYNRGQLIAPLDDVYIHLQYGKQIGEGHIFSYNTGDPITTGASSFLYALVLGAAWAAGFHGTALLAFAVVLGSLCLAATTVLVHLLGSYLRGRSAGLWAGVLVACCGPLVWGATSGMEVGLAAGLLTALVYAFVREQPRSRFVATALIGTATALVRPEGLVFVCFLCAAIWATVIVGGRRGRISRPAAARQIVWSLLPLAAGAGQLLFYRLATGSAAANGVQSKSLLYPDTFWPTEFVDEVAGNLRGFFSLLSGLSNQDFAFPGALALAVIGVFALANGTSDRRVLAFGWGLGMLAAFGAIATLRTAPWQNVRYIQPFLPLFLLLVVLGVHALARIPTEPHTQRVVCHGGLSVALLFSLAMLPTWAVRLGEEAATIRDGPVSIANWLKTHIPAQASIGVNDVGATAYFSEHRIVDVMGLTTNGTAEATNSGPGSLYEALRRMPAGQRPDFFSLYDSWPGPPVHELDDAGLLSTPLITFRLTTPKRPEPGLQTVCESDWSCPHVSVYRANWALADTGDHLHISMPGTLRDHLNVGDLLDEAQHGYQVDDAQVGLEPTTILRTVTYPTGRVADSGRHVIGGESFTATNLTPGKTLTIAARTQPTHQAPTATRQLQVVIGGHPAGIWTFTPDPLGWHESLFTIPANLITNSTLRIQLRPQDELLAPFPDYLSFGYWLTQ